MQSSSEAQKLRSWRPSPSEPPELFELCALCPLRCVVPLLAGKWLRWEPSSEDAMFLILREIRSSPGVPSSASNASTSSNTYIRLKLRRCFLAPGILFKRSWLSISALAKISGSSKPWGPMWAEQPRALPISRTQLKLSALHLT